MKLPPWASLLFYLVVSAAGYAQSVLPLVGDDLVVSPKQWAQFHCGLVLVLASTAKAWASRAAEGEDEDDDEDDDDEKEKA